MTIREPQGPRKQTRFSIFDKSIDHDKSVWALCLQAMKRLICRKVCFKQLTKFQVEKSLIGLQDSYQLINLRISYAGCADCDVHVKTKLSRVLIQISMSDFPKLYQATYTSLLCITFAPLACCCCCCSHKFWIGLHNGNSTLVDCFFSCHNFVCSVSHKWATVKGKVVIGGVTILQTWCEHLPENGTWILIS